MKQSILFVSTLTLLAIGLLTGAVFLLISSDQQGDDRFTVAATISPLADIVQNVAGKDANVITIIPSGASPHSFSVSAEQLTELQHAQIIFSIGHKLDTAIVDQTIRALPSKPKVVTVDRRIELHEFGGHEHEEKTDHEHEGMDPHYWLTIPNAQQIARNVAATLSEINPEKTDMYEANLETYLSQLDTVEHNLQLQASAAPQKAFVSTHNAWSYFAEHYGFELVGTYEPIEGQEPSPADLQELQQVIKAHDITTFYTEPQKRSTAATRFFERELGLDIGVLDPEGSTETDSYIELMQFNMNALTRS